MNNIIKLNIPADLKQILSLKIGDIVYLNGIIFTARDKAHQRIIEYVKNGKSLPQELISLKNHAIYHCGPIIKEFKKENKIEYILYSGGPTTSARIDSFEEEVIKILDIHIIIGKGGMKKVDFAKTKSVYLAFTGGCGAIFQSFVKKIQQVIWEDLGMPEAIWIIEVENFGPLIVAQDSNNKSLYLND